jgi:hypothetical protein
MAVVPVKPPIASHYGELRRFAAPTPYHLR